MKKTLYPRYCPNLLCQPEANLKAENERLKETAKIAIQEIGAWSRKAGKLEAENERLKEALSDYAGLANLVIGFINITPGHPLYMSIRQDIEGVLKVLIRENQAKKKGKRQ